MAKGRVLVTGGTGFLASHVVKILLEHGYRVRATVRSLTNSAKVEPLFQLCPDRQQYLELVEADLTEPESWRAAVRGCEYVIHVASPLPVVEPTSRNRDAIIRPAVDGTLNVLRAALAEGVKKVVVTSSSLTVYDTIRAEPDNGHVHDESEWTQLDDEHHHFKRWAYVESKVRAERAAWDFHAAQPDRPGGRFALTTILPTIIIGPVLHGQSGGTSQQIIEILMNRRPKFVLNVGLALCDVRDVALAHVRALEIDDNQDRRSRHRQPEQIEEETTQYVEAGPSYAATYSATTTVTKTDSTDGMRVIVYSRSASLVELAQILQREFEPLGYNISARKEPALLAKLTIAFNSSFKRWSRMLNRLASFNNTRMRTILHVEPTPIEKSIIDMAHSMIQRGDVHMTPRYAEWLARHPESNYFQQDQVAISRRVDNDETAHLRKKGDYQHGLYSQAQSDIVSTTDRSNHAQDVPMRTFQTTTTEVREITTVADRDVAGPSSRVSSPPRVETTTTTVERSVELSRAPTAAQRRTVMVEDMTEPEVEL